jgi:hypothetical protein
MPGLTYLGESKKMGVGRAGAHRRATWTQRKRLSIRQSVSIDGLAWLRQLTDWFAPSLRVDGRIWGNVHGADPAIDPKFDPEGDPHRQGGRRVDLLAGTNFYVPSGVLKGVRLSLEAGVPVYESLNGPQLSTRWLFSAGLTYSF